MHGVLFLFQSGSGKRAYRTCSYVCKAYTGSGRIHFPGGQIFLLPKHIILEADSISCLIGQNFLGKCVPPDTLAGQTDFPPTSVADLSQSLGGASHISPRILLALSQI